MGIEHELRQCTMQSRDAALHYRKARASQFGGDIEIQSKWGADIDMVLDFEIKTARGPDLAHLDIGSLIRSHCDRLVRQVWHRHHEVADVMLQSFQTRIEILLLRFSGVEPLDMLLLLVQLQ